MKKFCTLILVLIVSGCASITGNKLQPVSIQTIEDNKEVAGAGCTLTNDAGKWFVTTPGSVTIQKSTGDLAVDCTKDNGAVGHENVVSKANGGVWGNIILGGGIGYVVDRNTGAGFDYPATISVMLNKIGTAIGIPIAPVAQAVTTNTMQQATSSSATSTDPATPLAGAK